MNHLFIAPTKRPRSVFDFMEEVNDLFRNSELTGSKAVNWAPAADVQEVDQGYLLSFDLPGVRKEDININLQEQRLTISGQRQSKKTHEGAHSRTECFFGSFERSFVLPKNVEHDQISANHHDGVLEVFIPKKEQVKPKKIEIGSGSSGFLANLLGDTKKDSGKPH